MSGVDANEARDRLEALRLARSLTDGYYFSIGDQLRPEGASWVDSLVIPCYEELTDSMSREAAELGGNFIHATEVHILTRRAAAAGCSAIALRGDGFETILPLYAPAEDPLTPRPTHIVLSRKSDRVIALGRRGVVVYEPWQLVPWTRYDLLDPTSVRVLSDEPLMGWTGGAPVFELRFEGRLVQTQSTQLLGAFASPGGVITYGTSIERCQQTVTQLARDQFRTGIFVGHDPDAIEVGDRFEAVPIHDISRRLRSLDLQSKMYGINPFAPRYSAGWGLLISPETLFTIGGEWTWKGENTLSLERVRDAWSGFDSCHHDGGVRASIRGIDVSFRMNLELDEGDLVQSEFFDAICEILTQPWRDSRAELAGPNQPGSLDDFMLVGWRVSTGGRFVLYFRDIIEASQWLLSHEQLPPPYTGLHISLDLSSGGRAAS